MELYRIFLLIGLLAHKVLWEVLKRKEGALATSSKGKKPVSLKVSIVKLGKLGVLVGLLIQTAFLNIFPITSDPSMIRAVGLTLFTMGLGTAILGRIQLGDNWVDLEDYQVLPEQSMVASGIYQYIRHPIYAGDLVLLLGLELALNSWLVLGVLLLAVVVFRQTQAEERVLALSFPSYVDYCKRTKRFIPFVL